MLKVRCNDIGVKGLDIGIGQDGLGIRVGGSVDGKPVEGIADRSGSCRRVQEGLDAGPQISQGVGSEPHAGHNAEVVASASQGPEQVRVLSAGCNGADRAVGQNNLVLVDVVTRPATAGGEEGETATKCQTTDSNGRDSSTDDSEALRLKERVDIEPDQASAHGGLLLVSRDRDGVEVDKINGQAVANVGGACKGSVATTLDSELALRDTRSQDCKRDLGGRRGSEAAGGPGA